MRADATTYAWGGVVAQGVAMVIGIAATKPRLAGLLDRKTTARAFRLGIPVALGSLSYFVLNAGDRLVVQRLLGPDEVARYQIAYVVGSAVILLLTFTNQAWAPLFAALRDGVARRQLAMHSRDELYKLLAPVLLAVTLVSPIALPILAPASYRVEHLTVVVFVVAITAFPVVASGATGRLLLIERRGVAVGVIGAVAGVVNIGANLLLVPVLGIAGAGPRDGHLLRGPRRPAAGVAVRPARVARSAVAGRPGGPLGPDGRRCLGVRPAGPVLELRPDRRRPRLHALVLPSPARGPRRCRMSHRGIDRRRPRRRHRTTAARPPRVGVVTNGLAITGGVPATCGGFSRLCRRNTASRYGGILPEVPLHRQVDPVVGRSWLRAASRSTRFRTDRADPVRKRSCASGWPGSASHSARRGSRSIRVSPRRRLRKNSAVAG